MSHDQQSDYSGPHLLCINGWYSHKKHGRVRLTHIDGLTAVVTRRENSKDAAWLVLVKELEGPTNIPCPICGEIQIVRSCDGMQIDLAEHIDRRHFVQQKLLH